MPDNVSLVGCGAESTAILMDHASNKLIGTSGVTTYAYARISGFRLASNQANSGAVISLDTAANFIIENCYIGSALNDATELLLDNNVGSNMVVRNCTFECGSATTKAILSTHASGVTRVENCVFLPAASQSADVVNINDGYVSGCEFNKDGTALGTVTLLKVEGDATIVGNKFVESTGTVTAIELGTIGAADEVHEDGNSFGTSLTAYSYTATDGQRIVLGSRIGREKETTDDGATVTIAADQYEVIVLKRTTDTAQVISANKAPPGSKLILFIWWTNAGVTNDPTFSTDFRTVGAVAVANGEADVRYFVSEDFAGTLKWTQVNTKISVTV